MKKEKLLMKNVCSKLFLLLFAVLFLNGMSVSGQATVETDKADYYPGEVVTITGSGWESGETVQLLIEHLTYDHPTEEILTTADVNGGLLDNSYIIDPWDLGEAFLLTATGQSSGMTATAEFTDGDFLGTIEIGEAQGYFIPGQPGEIKFPVNVTRSGPANGNFDVRVCISSDFPAYISYDFDATGYLANQGIIEVATGDDLALGMLTVKYDGTLPVDEDAEWTFSIMGYVLPKNNNENYNCSNPTNDNATGTFQGKLAFGYAPSIACPEAITLPTEAGTCAATANWDLTYTEDDQVALTPGQYNGYPEPDIEYSLDGVVYSPGTGSGISFPKGTTTVYLKAENNIGTATCNFTVTVEDNEAPTLIGDDCSSLDNIGLDWCLSDALAFDPTTLEGDVADLYQDNCPGDITASHAGTIEGNENRDCRWQMLYTYTISDVAGNTTTCSVKYTGGDQSAPELVAEAVIPQGETGMNLCYDDMPAGPTAGEIALLFNDNCTDDVNVDKSKVARGDNCGWQVTYTYKIYDDCGNYASDIVVVYSGSDQNAPQQIGRIPQGGTDLNLCFDEMPTGPTIPEITALFSEDCSKVNVEKSREAKGDDCRWEVIYTFKVYDDCGNSADDVIVKYNGWDQDAPQLARGAVIPEDEKDMNRCFINIPAGPTPEAIAALFTEDCGSVYVDKSGTPVGDDCRWAVTYNYKIYDDCGNYADDINITYNGWDHDPPVLIADAVIPEGGKDLDLCFNNIPDGPTEQEIADLFTENCNDVNVDKTGTPLGDDCRWAVTYNYKIYDNCGNYASDINVTYNGWDQTAPTVITKDISVSLDENGLATITGIDVDDGSYDNCGGEVTFALDKSSFTCSDLGENTVTLTVSDKCGNSATGTATVTVTVPTVTTALVSADAARYMDEVTLYAEIESYCGIADLTGNVDFYIGDNLVGSAPAYPIPAGEEGYPDKLRATLIHKITENPKTDYENELWAVRAEFTPVTSYYEESSDETGLYIYPREADPFDSESGFYTGTILAWTTGQNSSTGTITMAAMLKDNNTPMGDLRGAKVTFCYVNSDNSLSPIPSAKDLPVSLIDMTDGTVGAASADVQIDIGKDEAVSFRIAVMVTGGYENNPNSEAAQALVTVAKPVAGGSIFGAGKLKNRDSEGQIKGALDKMTEFSFNVQYNKKQTNPQGKMSIMVRSWYKPNGTLDNVLHNYIITSNAINLMVLGENEGLESNQAIFDAKANLSEMLEDGTIVNVEGNSPLHVRMTDGGETPEEDLLAITYYNSAGGIWFSSNFKWEDVGDEVTEEQELIDGEIVVESDASAAGSAKPGKNKSAFIAPEAATGLQVYPNPFSERVRFEFTAQEDVNARIEVFDMTGRKVKTVFERAIHKGMAYHAEFNPETSISGMYLYRLTMGDKVFNGKLIYKTRE